jgi:hypothetical protein
VDVFQTPPVPERLRAPLRQALRRERPQWPSDLTDVEVAALLDHGVAPLLYSLDPLPALRGAAMRAAVTEPLRADDLREVLAAFAAAGVDNLLLKGTALGPDLYDAPELRPRADVDLLVARDAVPAATRVFTALGYTGNPTSGDTHALRQVTLSRVDAYGMSHDYDLHWGVANNPVFAGALRFDDLLARSVAIPKLGPHARGLCAVDALLLACIHRVAHHHDSDRLIWLIDIALLRGRMSSEEHREFWRKAAEARVVAVCERSIALADEWMSRPPHDRAADHLEASEMDGDEPSRAFLDREMTYAGEMLANFRALPWRARVERLWHLAFPPPAFVLQSFGTRNRLALPWLYVRRGARGVARLFRRV